GNGCAVRHGSPLLNRCQPWPDQSRESKDIPGPRGLDTAAQSRHCAGRMDYRVELPDFHGPLDLLLYLVKKNEVDVRDIPIARIAAQFQEYLSFLQVADIELAGDFLVMAATLMEIKSRMLLPQPGDGAAAAVETDDPRRELVKQLVEYKKFKEAAARLEERA